MTRFLRVFTALTFLFLCFNARAIDIEWYQPELNVEEDQESLTIFLSGKTQPNVKVEINEEQIRFIGAEGEIDKEPLMSASGNVMSGSTNDDGIFSLSFRAVPAKILVPIEVQGPEGQNSFLLTFQVDTEEVILQTEMAKVLAKSPVYRKNWRLWGGFGFNYLALNQSSPSVADLSFDSLRGPALYYETGYYLTPNLDLQASYKNSPGATSSSQDIRVLQGSYIWETATLDLIHTPESWSGNYAKKPIRFGYLFGVQVHNIPFVVRDEGTANVFSVETDTLMQASLGPVLLYQFSKEWTFESFMRLQMIIQSGDLFEAEGGLSFDGSVGVHREYGNNFLMGLFWYGQFLNFDHTHTDPFLGENVSGTTDLFFSNLELRIGLQF